MGGMVAMAAALREGSLFRSVVVVDIAPRSYAPHHDREFAALELDVSKFQTRSEVEEAMKGIHPSREVRQFLQMNLKRTQAGFAWKLNVEALKESSFTSKAHFEGRPFQGPSLFVTGSASPYVRAEDHKVIVQYFPKARIRTIEGAGHWLHYSHQAEFLKLLQDFIYET